MKDAIALRFTELPIVERTFPVLAIVAFFLVWEAACRMFDVPVFILPKPSEFLAVLAMVVLSIWLREKDSPESKDVDAPHFVTGS